MKMKSTRTLKIKRTIAILLAVALTVTSGVVGGVNPTTTVVAATNGIIKGLDTPNEEDSFTTTLSSGETTTIKVVNSVLTIKVAESEYTFQIGNITKTTDAAVINEKDGLLHILTLGGAYYVFDLYTGVQIVAYRNSSNGKYCSSRNSYAYMVYGRSLINNTYFYELLTSNSVVRELLMTRYEFDIIVKGGDPSVDVVVEPTTQSQQPTQTPTETPTTRRVVFDFEYWWSQYESGAITLNQFLQILVSYGWSYNVDSTGTIYTFYDDLGNFYCIKVIKVEAPTQQPTEAPTQQPTEAPTQTQTQQPTQAPTQQPTEALTQTPTQQQTQAPTLKPIEVPTLKPIELPTVAVETEFDFEFWWKQYVTGNINWEQFCQAVWQNQWVISTETGEQSDTYYFYDESGKLIQTRTITTGQKVESGQGQGAISGNSTGSANVNVKVEGEGGVKGSSTTVIKSDTTNVTNTTGEKSAKPYLSIKKTTIYAYTSKTIVLKNATDSVTWKISNPKVASIKKIYGKNYQKIKLYGKKNGKVTVTATHKGKKYKAVITVKCRKARVTTYKSTVRIYRGKNRLNGTLNFNRKTGVLKYRGYKVTGVTDAGFINKSHNVIFIKNEKAYKIPKSASKGQIKHKQVISCNEVIITLNRNSYGFVTSVRTKGGCVKNVTNK